jgi:hypothetical protein
MNEIADKLYSVRCESQRASQWSDVRKKADPVRMYTYIWQRSEIFIVL